MDKGVTLYRNRQVIKDVIPFLEGLEGKVGESNVIIGGCRVIRTSSGRVLCKTVGPDGTKGRLTIHVQYGDQIQRVAINMSNGIQPVVFEYLERYT